MHFSSLAAFFSVRYARSAREPVQKTLNAKSFQGSTLGMLLALFKAQADKSPARTQESAMRQSLETSELGSGDFGSLLRAGWQALENSDHDQALRLFRQAAVADLRRPEPWYGMGLLQERLGDHRSAAYCYYLACDMQTGFPPAKQALQKLGYLDVE
jgi:hypothetical protein